MADAQMGPIDVGFVDKRRGRTYDGVTLTEANNYDTIPELKARLTALAPTKYSATQLAKMSTNDLVYALRLESADSAGIK